jgi:phage shock protein C
MSNQRRLYRSRENNQIAGVCGGIGEYLNIDPTLIRIIFVLMAFFGGPGLLLYILFWVVMPEEPEEIVYRKRKRKNDEYYEDLV